MAKIIVKCVSKVPSDGLKNVRVIDLRLLNDDQKKYFEEAWGAFHDDMNCWDFDEKFFMSSSSAIWELLSGRGKAPRKHPLFLALKELWLSLGVSQGQMTAKNDRAVYLVI